LGEGTRKAWIRFRRINGLVIRGGGQIDGQGAPWWNAYFNSEIKRPTVSWRTHIMSILFIVLIGFKLCYD